MPILRALSEVDMGAGKVDTGRGWGQLTAGDWIGVALALLGAVSILFEGWVLLWQLADAVGA